MHYSRWLKSFSSFCKKSNNFCPVYAFNLIEVSREKKHCKRQCSVSAARTTDSRNSSKQNTAHRTIRRRTSYLQLYRYFPSYQPVICKDKLPAYLLAPFVYWFCFHKPIWIMEWVASLRGTNYIPFPYKKYEIHPSTPAALPSSPFAHSSALTLFLFPTPFSSLSIKSIDGVWENATGTLGAKVTSMMLDGCWVDVAHWCRKFSIYHLHRAKRDSWHIGMLARWRHNMCWPV